MLIIFAFYTFPLSVIVLKILAKNSKNHQNLRSKANNSYKDSSDDFGVMEGFVELDLLIILLFKVSLYLLLFSRYLATNSKNRQNLRLKANNSCKESSDDFSVTETFVELNLMITFAFTISLYLLSFSRY